MRSTSSAVSQAAAGVYAGLAAQVVSMAALAVFEETRGRRLAAQIAAFGGDPAAPAAQEVTGPATAFAVLVLLLLAATAASALAYLAWLRRVRPATPPAALAAACLVPGINLVLPPILADRAWREPPVSRTRPRGLPGNPEPSGPRSGRDRVRWLVLLSCWWLSWLATLGLVFTGTDRTGLTGLGVPQVVAAAVAALLCAATVRAVTVRHDLAARGRGLAGAAGSTVRPVHAAGGETGGEKRAAILGETRTILGETHAIGGESHAMSRDAHTAYATGGGAHRPGGGPELPELACQSLRWGSPWPRNRPSRAAGGAPLSE